MIVRFNQLQYEELILVEQKPLNQQDRPEVSNRARKLLFFFLREGFNRTLSKIKSKRNKKLNIEKRYTIITLKYEDKLYVNYSIQTSINPNDFIINTLFFEIVSEIDINSIKDKSIFNQFVQNDVNIGMNVINVDPIKYKLIEAKEEKGVFIYGLGDYSRVYIAPNIIKQRKIYCVDYNYDLAHFYHRKFRYDNFGLIAEESYHKLKNVKKPLAIIATYHSDHTRIAKEIFNCNPDTLIFIEKPPCVTLDDIKTLANLYDQKAKIEIGYNRRYISLNREIRDLIYNHQKVINISVKEILINDNHWYFWKNQGSRITGNLTHWIDLSVFWINGSPVEINVLNSPARDETIAVSILFSEGSLVNITVSDKGNSLRGVQEYIEIRTKGETFFIEDYLKYTRVLNNGRKKIKRYFRRSKGHDKMYQHLNKLYNNKSSIQYPKEDLINTAMTTFYISEMYKNNIRNKKIELDHNLF